MEEAHALGRGLIEEGERHLPAKRLKVSTGTIPALSLHWGPIGFTQRFEFASATAAGRTVQNLARRLPGAHEDGLRVPFARALFESGENHAF